MTVADLIAELQRLPQHLPVKTVIATAEQCIQYWIALLNNSAPVTVRSENRTPANGTVFADGGYTGPGAKWQPAGVVEYSQG